MTIRGGKENSKIINDGKRMAEKKREQNGNKRADERENKIRKL